MQKENNFKHFSSIKQNKDLGQGFMPNVASLVNPASSTGGPVAFPTATVLCKAKPEFREYILGQRLDPSMQ